MENDKKQDNKGLQVFMNFVKSIPEGISEFDYFSFLDHISKNNFDKQTILNILSESKTKIKSIIQLFFRK